MRRAIGLVAGEQDVVMRPFHRVDAVHLDETEIVDEVVELGAGQRPPRPGAQALQVEKRPPRRQIGDRRRHGRNLKRFQEKWNPVFRPETRKKSSFPGKVESGFPSGNAQEKLVSRKSGIRLTAGRVLKKR